MHKNIFFGVLALSLCFIFLPSVWAESESKTNSTISLDEVLQATLSQNPELKAMQKDVEATKAKVPQARSWDDPQVGLRLYQVPFNNNSGVMDIDYIVSQKIPFPGKKKAASQIAYHEYLHHLELLGGKGRSLIRDVKITYYDLFAVSRQLEQNRKIEGILRGLIQTAQAKLATGEVMATDAIQAQAELAKVMVEREPLLERKRNLEAKLKQLMSSSSDQAINLPSQLEIPKWNIELEKLIEIAQLKNPNIKLAKHDIGQKEWGLKAAKREYLPDLNAQMEYVQRPASSPNASLGNAWTGEFMVNVPLFFQKKKKGVEQAEAELASAKYSHSAAKNDVLYKVKESYSKMKSATRILEINGSTLIPQTRQAYQVTSAAYATGKTNFINFLTAARSFFEAEMEYWKSYESVATSIYELEEAVGATREELAEKLE